ncbi:diphthine methyltransferase isoform X2 [Haematobia irritans]
MLDIQLIHSVDTEYSADSVEWCPHPGYNNLFVCGTYQLKEKTEDNPGETPVCQRKGRIYLYEFDTNLETLVELDRIETAAILDMKWLSSSNNELPILAAATALGNIDIFLIEESKLKYIQGTNLNPVDKDLLALSLDWGKSVAGENMASNNLEDRIITSDSKGNISLLSWSAERNLEMIRTWHAHDFEAWICAFDKWNKNLAYTGGDDTFLLAYDMRTDSRVFLNKSHNAGVTCLLSHPKRENILLTGSYDEKLRIFDSRSMKAPLAEIDLQGGIWRIKSDPLNHNFIICACMYHNFSVVDLTNVNSPLLVGEFNEHKSICYGADWCLNVDESDAAKLYMATCSFYDHKLCISSIDQLI